MKHIEKDIPADEKFIQSLAKSDNTKQINISLQINPSLQHITSSVQKFGDITVSSNQCDLSILKRKDRQAQTMVALSLPIRKIENLTLTFQKRIETELTSVCGCSMLPDGRMVFSCYAQDKILVLKTDGSKDFEINKIGYTFDVVIIGEDSIAVTSGESNQINIINFKKRKVRKTIKVNSNNYGVVYKDGHLIYCAEGKGLHLLSLNDESITNFAYVTTAGDKLFYTDGDNHSVTCCDYHGNILWTFRNKSVLAGPNGISVDNDGNLYVAGVWTQNVVVISPDGQLYRQILSFVDGLDSPLVLHYDQSTDTLLVASDSNQAWLYEVTDNK
ncbi:unnamed protein product [Mytilus edulis]|uniref:SMP-30/Gluconolactonase/LRE-like region domain-containing protein n=1 Tax=Mytilus edulis TaxID=6550 RepID=A0A8S3S246_MYTED|nr:unnamed protein product [Mytilus edulis]